MKKNALLFAAILFIATHGQAQVEPNAGNWKTWFISSGKDWRLPPPPSGKAEIAEVISRQQSLNAVAKQQILYWNTGAPNYRWQEMMNKLWMNDTSGCGVLANMLLGVATYDAIIAAWDTKYAYKRNRPFVADHRVKVWVPEPESPSYPCEHSVAAGVAVAVISHFYPGLADSVQRLATQAMTSRIAAGVAFPSDTHAGFELGKRIAAKEIAHTKNYMPRAAWDGKRPDKPGIWNGKKAMFPLAGNSQTVVLDSASQFRPGPPPNFAKEMEELRNFKPSFQSTANAFYYATQPEDVLGRKIFEYNWHLNPPRAARIYAITAVGLYDGFVACWDAKYTYWGIRPDQYDTTFRPVLLHTPPFPGYPSGHALLGGVMAELCTYFFPTEKAYFDNMATDGAESRFQGGIHFRTDNEVGLAMGRKIGAAIVKKVKTDGAGNGTMLAKE